MSRFLCYGVLLLTLLVAGIFSLGCPITPKQTVHFSCTDPQGNPAICWGVRWVFSSDDPGFGVDDSNPFMTLVMPSGYDVTSLAGTNARLEYTGTANDQITAPLSIDSALSSQLTAQAADGNSYWAMRTTLTSTEYDTFLAGVPAGEDEIEASVDLVLNFTSNITDDSKWNPFTATCYGQANDALGLYELDSGTLSLGHLLSARAVERIYSLADQAFSGVPSQRRSELEYNLETASNATDGGILDLAYCILKEKVINRMDGSFGGSASDDWIVTTAGQSVVHPYVDQFLTQLTPPTSCDMIMPL